MARDTRLQQVHEADLTEGRINVEFLDWLKTKGPTWLLLILVFVAGYMAILRYKQYRVRHVAEAWAAFAECRLPGSFEDVAVKYDGILGLPQQARLAAAAALMETVQTGQSLASDPSNPSTSVPLTDDDRQANLNRAGRLYREVLESDDGSLAITLYAVNAMQGLAVVAESRGDAEDARHWYDEAAVRAEKWYPHLAARIRGRGATAAVYSQPISLPAESSLPPAPAAESRRPAVIDDALRKLIETDAGG